MPLKNKNFNKLPDPLAEKAKSEAAVQKSNTEIGRASCRERV